MVAIFSVAPLAHTAMTDDLIVVATRATFKDAQGWVDFLKSKEIPIKHVTPQEYANFSKEKYIVLMGGMDELDGIKDIVQGLLTKEELEYITRKGKGKMYKKYVLPKNARPSQLWGGGQNYIIFAGADRTAAATARKNSKKDWWEELSVWFDIDESPAIPPY